MSFVKYRVKEVAADFGVTPKDIAEIVGKYFEKPRSNTQVLPDEQPRIESALIHAADEEKLALIVTTGGTGFAPRDVTPEATIKVCEKLAPGITEAMRAASMQNTPKA